MQTPENAIIVSHVIQQAVAPVFLLTGIGAVLSVLTSRLARAVDRFRVLKGLSAVEQQANQHEITTLWRRARWAQTAITLSTVSALLICFVIVALFVGSQLSLDTSTIVSLLFIAAMVALIMALLCFLREIVLATGTINREGRRK